MVLKNILKFYLKQNKIKGFTLLELLVAIVIIGILAAIALPNFMTAIAKAKQSEPKTTIGSVNRAQQGYRSEKSEFARNMGDLGVGLPTKTKNYFYEIKGGINEATITAQSSDTALRGYSGGVVQHTNGNGESAIASVMCEAVSPGVEKPAPPVLDPNATSPEEAAKCGEGQKQL